MIGNNESFINKCFSKNGNINKHAVKRLTKDEIQYILNLFEYVDSINEALFRIKHNILVRPTCKICGKNVKFNGCAKRPYSDCCCPECADIYRQQQIRSHSLEKYGVDHPAKTQENINKHKEYYRKHKVKEKLLESVRNKYGVDNVLQLESVKEKSKKTCLEKYSVDNVAKSAKIQEKIKETCLKKYGEETPFKSKEIKQKIKETLLDKYGVDNPAKSEQVKEKTKKTDIEKYGCPYHITSNEIKEKSKSTLFEHYNVYSTFESKEIRERIKQHNIKKYGTEYHQQSDQKRFENNSLTFREYMSNVMSSDEVREKIYLTHKANNSFNKSKTEDETYELLKDRYPDVIRQYKSDKYPFVCDFYIPSKDLYIECNYHWTHGSKQFEGTEEDKEKIKSWKSKNTKYYDNAIYVWSILDVKKRSIAKQNKLNWIEFFSIFKLKEWISNEI